MIPRYQRILFWSLVAAILLMTLFLLRGCEQAHQRLTAEDSTAPIAAPSSTTTQDVTLYLANDAEGSITPTTRKLPLPDEATTRARAILQQLFAEYALPISTHPLSAGPTAIGAPPADPAVDDVFLLNLPGSTSDSPQQAVVSLHGTFVAHHPSGIEVEDLTLQSVIGTLHAAFPDLTQIRFLVDGQPHDTLAGHADLQHTYPATDTTYKPSPPTPDKGSHE